MHTTSRRDQPMQTQTSWHRTVVTCWLPIMALPFLTCAPAAWSQALPGLSSEQVVQRLMEKNGERAAALQHYVGKRSYRLEYHGFPASAEATMEVEVNYDAPATKHFTIVNSTGSKLIQT
ncbi:MAG TPA: hypothetical protein VN828_02235, partial [Acidobacteriaceae bacterium]|nr:hypothetical protein [Acidobacteriaceae bacterium]